jgi:hypothetical protein
MAQTKSPKADTAAGATPAAMATIISANPVFAQAWMDMMSEGARFMTERLRTDFETQQALMSCKTPAEFMEIQSQFLSTAMQQYADQAARVMDMAMGATKDIAEDVTSGHSRDYDDIPI